jgi:LysM repeat protein
MRDTYYGNPSGLPAATVALDNSSTPIDQLVLALELLNHEEVLRVTGLGYAQVHNGRMSCMLRNHNGLAIKHAGDVDGLKTGYTRRAGFCLVGTTEKCGHRLISIVLGCRGPQIRNEVVRNMFNAYYTSIGLDPIGDYCPAPAPLAVTPVPAVQPEGEGKWVSVSEKGEYLTGIASRYRVSVKQLRSWNPGKVHSNGTVYAGQRLNVYTTATRNVWVSDAVASTKAGEPAAAMKSTVSKPQTPVKEKISAASSSSKGGAYVYHTVVPGDTLFSIARKYGITTIEQIKDLNGIRDPRTIRPGMKLKVKVRS